MNDIFRRLIVEFGVLGSGKKTSLREERQFRVPYMVDNVHIDSHSGTDLWVGAVGMSHDSFFGGLDALQANASTAYEAAVDEGSRAPRPHLLLRPSPDDPPQPPMPSGVLHVDLKSGEAALRLLQHRELASVSWSHRVGERWFMGSPWDDGVLVCPVSD